MLKRNIVIRLSLAATLAVFPVTLAAGESAKEGLELMKNVESSALKIRTAAEALEMYNSLPGIYSERSHFDRLGDMKFEINSIAPTVVHLSEIQSGLPGFDQQALDRVFASMKKLAAGTNAALLKASETGSHVSLNPEYRQLVTDLRKESDNLVKTLGSAVTYSKALDKIEKLEHSGSVAGSTD